MIYKDLINWYIKDKSAYVDFSPVAAFEADNMGFKEGWHLSQNLYYCMYHMVDNPIGGGGLRAFKQS